MKNAKKLSNGSCKMAEMQKRRRRGWVKTVAQNLGLGEVFNGKKDFRKFIGIAAETLRWLNKTAQIFAKLEIISKDLKIKNSHRNASLFKLMLISNIGKALLDRLSSANRYNFLNANQAEIFAYSLNPPRKN